MSGNTLNIAYRMKQSISVNIARENLRRGDDGRVQGKENLGARRKVQEILVLNLHSRNGFPLIHILQFIILLTLIEIPPYLSSNVYYEGCDNLLSCGNTTDIGFPFWGEDGPNECGHTVLQLTCQNNISYITIKNVKYQVLEANPAEHTLRITREDYLQELCPSKIVNTILDTLLFVYGSCYNNLTLFYGFPASNDFSSSFGRLPCLPNGASDEYLYTWLGSSGPPALTCKGSVVVPALSLFDIHDFTKTQEAIRDGFVVRWTFGVEECDKCQKSGGFCGYNWLSNQTTCNCRDHPDAKAPPVSGSSTSRTSEVAGVEA